MIRKRKLLCFALYLCGGGFARANCPYIEPYEADAAKRSAIYSQLSALKEQCSSEGLALMRQLYSIRQTMDALVDRATSDSRCVVDASVHSANVRTTRRMPDEIATCALTLARKPSSPNPAQLATKPASAPGAKSFLRCASDNPSSTITGLPDDPDAARANPVSQADKQCVAAAQWTRSQPYNHGKAPIVFVTHEGQEVTVNLGESLWSIKDESVPRGRRLVSRKWNNEPLSGADCAQEATNATTRDFQVSIICELGRQADRQNQFESREDNCIPQKQCQRKPDFLADWHAKPSRYWLDNPQQPIGTCVVSTRDNREDRRCVREEDWHTAAECKQYGHSVQTNLRGLSGCSYNEGTTTGPDRTAQPKKPDHPSGNWFVIAGSWPSDQSAKATQRLTLLSEQNITVHIIKTDGYPKLTPGLLAVVGGPFNKAEAELNLLQIQSFVPDAFIKEGK
jgi:hypothetical protein